MKTTLTLLSLLSFVTIATAAQPVNLTGSEENAVCSTDAKNIKKCKVLTQDELVTPKIAEWGTGSYYVYKSQEKNSVSYSDVEPSHKNYKKIDLNSESMKEKLTFYKTDPLLLEQAQKDRYDSKVVRAKEDKLNYVKTSLAYARTSLYNLRPERDEDWTYSGRTRILSPYYTEKEMMLKKEVIKFELELENLEK